MTFGKAGGQGNAGKSQPRSWLNLPDSAKTANFMDMTDLHSTEIRSYNMSRIKGKSTQPEILALKPSAEADSLSRSLSGAKDIVFIYSNAYSEQYPWPPIFIGAGCSPLAFGVSVRLSSRRRLSRTPTD